MQLQKIFKNSLEAQSECFSRPTNRLEALLTRGIDKSGQIDRKSVAAENPSHANEKEKDVAFLGPNIHRKGLLSLNLMNTSCNRRIRYF